MRPNLLVVSMMVAWAAPALADIPPPEDHAVAACDGLSAGQACTLAGTGACQQATCSKDWAHRDDAGQPGVGQVACVKCDVPKPGPHLGCGLSSASPTACELGALAMAGSFSLLFLSKRRRSRS